MAAAPAVRDDMPAAALRWQTRLEADGRVACSLLALANALHRMIRAKAARHASMDC